MSIQMKALGEILRPSGKNRAGKDILPILSVTMKHGLVDQSEKFKKRIASKNTSTYKIVYADELVVGFPIDEGVLGFQQLYPVAVVSPAYQVWRLKEPDQIHIPFVERYLRSDQARSIYASKMRRGVARRRTLTKEAFLGIEIPIPPLEEQKRIATILDKADALRRLRQDSIYLTEKLIQSVFINMFGDPVSNPKDWPTSPLGTLGIVQTGNTPPRSNRDNYSPNGIEWIKTNNLVEGQLIASKASEKLSEKGESLARIAPEDSLLVACIAGSEKSIGRAAIVDRRVAFNQQINAITPHKNVSPIFLYYLLKTGRSLIQNAAAKGMKKIVNKKTFESIQVIVPDYKTEQLAFEKQAQSLLAQAKRLNEQQPLLDDLFQSLQQRAFRGELKIKKIITAQVTETLSSNQDVTKVVHKETLRKKKHTNDGKYRRPGYFKTPPELEALLMEMEEQIDFGPDDSIPWSEEYFKYRTLSQICKAPYTFEEIWNETIYDMEEADYETVKDTIINYLESGDLEQRFHNNKLVLKPAR